LRLLAMPETLGRIAGVLDGMLAKHRFMAESLGGAHRPDAADALVSEIERESRDLGALLRDRARCAFSWLLLPEVAALEEACDGVHALESAGLTIDEIVINRVTPPPAGACRFCRARRRSEAAVIAATRAAFAGRSILAVPDRGAEPRGASALAALARSAVAIVGGRAARVEGGPGGSRRGPPGIKIGPRGVTTDQGVLDLLAPPGLRLIIVAGKGGVGKTSCAAALALGLAEREPERRVLLLSTDPAHSLGDVLDEQQPGTSIANPLRVDGIDVVELDAESAFAVRRARYRDAVNDLFDALRGGSRFDATFDRAVVQDLLDLAPSGLDEIFGMVGIIEALSPPEGGVRSDVVVLDTAPTGHALRLLEMPKAALEWVHALLAILLKYRKVIGLGELGADLVDIARDLRRLQSLLGDPKQTRAVVVTRAADVPRLETARLLAALKRLGVAVSGVVINALTPAGCARCRRIATAEQRALRGLGHPCAIMLAPAEVPPPRGAAALARWRDTWTADSR